MSGSTPVIRGNSLYTIANGSAWNTARRSAEKLGGALVSIEDGKENKFVFDNFGYDPETGKTISSGYWIGFTDQDQEGSWKWISGADSQWMPSSFRPGVYGYEPNGNGDHAWVKSGFGLNQLGLPMRSREEIEETAPDIFLIEGPGWDDTWESGEGTNYGVAEIPFIRRGDSAYVIVEGPTWEEAEANANALGGHLVTINDAEENEWIVKTFRDANKSPYPGTIGDTDIYWNGLLLSDNSWRWSNGEPLDYTNWGYKAPWGNGDRGQFILEADKNLTEPLWSDTDGKWNDMYNDLRYGGGWHGIAEIPLAPNNKPTGTPTLTGDFKVGQTISIDASSIEDADNFEGWTPTYEYSWEVTGDNGSSWTELTSADATDGDDSYTLTSEEDGKQLRGVVSYLDGYGTNESVKSITMTLNSSSVELIQDSQGMYWVKLTNGQQIKITNQGQQVGANSYRNWEAVAASIIDEQNKVIWKHTSGKIAEWNVDDQWNKQRSIKHMPCSTGFTALEQSFQMDFDNDGEIGLAYTTVESTGDTTLLKDNCNMNWVQPTDGSLYAVKANNIHVGTDTYSGWQLVAAETIDGKNKLIWSSNGERLSEWTANQDWNRQTRQVHSAGTSGYFKLEESFQMDFNNDGVVGHSYSTVESEGTVQLYLDSAGLNWIKLEDGTYHPVSTGGVQIGNQTYQGWGIAAADIIDGENKAIWVNDAQTQIVEWTLDSSWNLQGRIKYNEGTDEFLVIEESFQTDFNNDGVIGKEQQPATPVSSTVRGNSLYTIVDGPSWTQAEANSVKLGGHLVTINDAHENNFISSNPFSSTEYELYIGLRDYDLDASNDVWRWSSEENSEYLNWAPGQPDDPFRSNTSAIRISNFNRFGNDVTALRGAWRDLPGLDEELNYQYEGVSKGLAEIRFIRRGDSAYVIVEGPTWEEAEANANALGGHLVAINDADENQWLVDNYLVPNARNYFIGATDRGSEGVWSWASNDEFKYSNWYVNEPNNADGGEDYSVISGALQDSSRIGFWNDTKGLTPELGIAEIKLAPNNTPTGTLTLNGDFKIGQTISIDASAIEDADNFEGWSPTYEYSWEVSNDNGTTWTELTSSDATDGDDSYTLTSEEVGKQLRGVVRYLDGYGSNETVVTRKSNQITSSQCSTAKQWLRYSHQAGEDRSSGMAKFKNNDIATTFTLTNSNGSYSVIVQRLNDAGELIWSVDLEADYAPRAGSIVIGDDDTIYVTGSTKTGPSGESGKNDSDIFAMALTGEGEKLWYQNYGIGIHEIGSQAVFDKDGNIILNGRVSEVNDAFTFIKDVPNFYGASFTGGWRGFQLKINSSTGSVQHAYTTGSYNSGGELIAINQNSNIAFLGGYTFGSVNGINTIGNGDPAGANQYLIARDETTGVVLWTRMENWIRSNLAVQETEDAVYFMDKGNLEKVHGSTGQTIWSKTLENTNYFIAPINGGGVLVARGESTGSLHIQRYDADGSKAGSQVIEHQGTLYPHTLIENGNGYLLISGSTTGSVDASKDIITLNNKTESLDGFVMQVNSEFSDFQDDCNEAIDTINLQQDQNGLYLINTGDDQQIYITREGSNISDRTYPGWTMIAATNFNDTNRTAWMHSSGSITEWILDSNWSHQTSITHGESTDEFFEMEENFQMDFDGDSVIGRSFTTIESEGDISLMKDSSGNNWVRLTDGSMDDITTGGQRVGESTYGGWHIVAAETIDNLNTVIWLDQTNNMVVWNVDASWNFQVRFPHNPGSSGFNAVETSFQMDFDGNGTIGS